MSNKPKNRLGLTSDEVLDKVSKNGQYTQTEVRYSQDNPVPPTVCGTCRFFLRDKISEIGECQVVKGKIAWFGISDAYISAEKESVSDYEEMSSDYNSMIKQMKRVKSRSYQSMG